MINQALSIIQRDYYRQIDPNQLVNSGLAAAVASLHDPFSQYISPSSYTDFGNASPHVNGIGIDVQPDPRGLRVVDVFPGTPAAHAGLLPGDLIIKVGERALAGHSADYDSALIRGNAGSSVTLMVVRAGHPRSLTITRESITVPVADDRLLTYHGIKLGYVQLTTFNQVGAGNEVRGDVDQLLDEGARGLILDLRDNGGGLITEAVNVASIFIPSGTIVSTAGRNSAAPGVHRDGRRDLDQDPPRRARRSWHRLGVGDRHRRRCRITTARSSSARIRSARASSRRSSSSPTAARSTSRSASTSRRTAATSAAAGSRRAPASRPTCTRSTIRARLRTRR